MFKSRILSALALAALLGAAACGDSDEPQAEPSTQQPTPGAAGPQQQIDPAVTEGAVIMDTSAVGEPATGSPAAAAAGTDTAAAGH